MRRGSLIALSLLTFLLTACGGGGGPASVRNNTDLANLVFSAGALSPAFSPTVFVYTATVASTVDNVTFTPTAAERTSTITVNGQPVASGSPSAAQSLVEEASNTETDDRFGWSVALSGDTLAVGAHLEDSNARGINGDQANNDAIRSGAVYVFTRSGTTWIQQAYVKASNTEALDEFGWSVALSSDTLAVGAWLEDSNARGINGDQTNNGASQSGTVYLFARSGTIWTQQAYVKASNTEANDEFGWSVALSRDTLAVSARQEDSNARGINGDQTNNGASDSGAVYVLR